MREKEGEKNQERSACVTLLTAYPGSVKEGTYSRDTDLRGKQKYKAF